MWQEEFLGIYKLQLAFKANMGGGFPKEEYRLHPKLPAPAGKHPSCSRGKACDTVLETSIRDCWLPPSCHVMGLRLGDGSY